MRRLGRLFRNFFRRSRVEKDLSDELRGYVDELAARKIAQGTNADEARRRALAEVGSVEVLKERVREERTGFTFEAYVLKPLQTAVRGLRRSPGFTVTAVVTLALAIGANAAILSIADYILFRPLPYKDPDSVHVLQMRNRKTGTLYMQVLLQHLEAINAIQGDLSQTALADGAGSIIVTANGESTRVPAANVTANYFDVAGVTPYRGRLFMEQDAEEPGRVAVLTYPAWIKYFGGDDRIVGRPVQLGTTSFELIGVLPPKFVFPSQFIAPAEVIRVEAAPRPGEGGGTFQPIIRVRPGVTRERAQAQIDAAMAGLIPEERASPALIAVPDALYWGRRPAVAFLFGAAVLVLLIGSANLAIMLALRAKRGAREAGVRAALGASRVQLALPFVFEALMIGAIASTLAIAAAAASFKLLLAQVPEAVYINAPVGLDLRVALITFALGTLSGIVFAVVPAWRSARRDVQTLILGREEQVLRHGRVGGVLVAAQVALSVMLVFEAMGSARAFFEVINESLGFDPENVIVAQFNLRGNVPNLRNMYERAALAASQEPGVVSVGATHQMPLPTNGPFDTMKRNGEDVGGTGLVLVLPGYFETVQIPLKRGRLFTWEDLQSDPGAAVIGEAAARVAFPGQDPIGATFENSKGRRFHIVGVVGDTLRPTWTEPVAFIIGEQGLLTLVARVRARNESMLAAVRQSMSAAAPEAIISARWFEDVLGAQPRLRDPRFQTLVLGTFGGLALGLMAMGVFAVIAFAVAARTKEMGIRMAIGATPASLVRMMLRQTMAPVLVGVAAGLVAAKWSRPLVETYVNLNRPVASFETLALATAAVGIAALIAAFVPARRASRIDPAITLRAD